MSKELAMQQDNAMVSFIERAASDKEVDIEKFERLIELQNKERDRQARTAFYADMAMMQSEMPTVAESGEIKVNGQVRSVYAKYEDIVAACRPLLQKHGFSFSAKTDFEQNTLIVEGTVAHKLGHTESTKMRLPFDNSGAKNAVQAIGSSVSYGKRYVFCMLFNIATGGQDDDANTIAVITVDEAKTIKGRLQKTKSDVKKFCEVLGINSVDEMPLNLVAKANSMLNKKEQQHAGN